MQYLKKQPDKLAFFLGITAQKPIFREYPPYYYYKEADCKGFGIGE
jgi:hypothetical protein